MIFRNVFWMKTNVELFKTMQRILYYVRYSLRTDFSLNEGIALRFAVAWKTLHFLSQL